MNDKLPDNLRPDAFLSPEQTNISAALNKVEVSARSVINKFNPAKPGNRDIVSIRPAENDNGLQWSDIWAPDPKFAAMQQANMLRRLGFSEAPLSPHDDRVTAEYFCNYPDSGFAYAWQFYNMTRSDGTTIPVKSSFWVNNEGGAALADITLLSHDSVGEEMAATEQIVNEGEEGMLLNQRLQTQFGLGPAFFEHFGLTFQEKKDMLDAYDDIAREELDLDVLDSARYDVVTSMIKGSDFSRWIIRKHPDIKQSVNNYEQAIGRVAIENDMDSQTVAKLFKSEELLRLSELNSDYYYDPKFRHRIVDALGAYIGAVPAGGAVLERTHALSTTALAAVVGGTVGFGLIRLATTAYENSRRSDFSEETTQDVSGLRKQLSKEVDLIETWRLGHKH